MDRSYDLYDGLPNDPITAAQQTVIDWASTALPESTIDAVPQTNGNHTNGSVEKANPATSVTRPTPISNLAHLNEATEPTPRSSAANTPAPEGTPQPKNENEDTAAAAETELAAKPSDMVAEKTLLAERQDRILPLMPLDVAILESIRQGHRTDDRKARDFYGGILLVGGGAKFPFFGALLEERLRILMPGYPKEILIGEVPRELDPMLVVWKGGSVFARLSSSGNDSWVWKAEWEMLGAKLLAQKCMWNW